MFHFDFDVRRSTVGNVILPCFDQPVAVHIHVAIEVVGAQARKKKLGGLGLLVEQAALDEVVVNRERGGNQGAGVDLARAGKGNAILVDDVNLALRVDATTDL